MGQSASVSINFDNADKTYAAGDTVSGNVVIENNNSGTDVKGIQVILRGDTKAEWIKHNSHSTAFYKTTEKILGYTYFVLGDGSTRLLLPAGRSTFPLQFTLPANCPPSIKSPKYSPSKCNIKYFVEARILSSSSGVAGRIKEKITLNANVDLNMWPDANQPVVRMLSKDMKSKGILSIVIKIPKTGFLPGDVIPVEVHIDSGGSYKFIEIRLRQELSHHYSSSRHFKVTSLCKDKIPGGTYGRVQCPLCIPDDVPASSVGFSNVVEIQYCISVRLMVNWTTERFMDIPVIIGNVPHKNQNRQP